VRELENCVNRAASLSDGEIVLANELACHQGTCLSAELSRLQEGHSPIGGLSVGQVVTPSVSVSAPQNPPAAAPADYDASAPAAPLERRKTTNTAKEELIAAMEEAGWVQAKAARLLGLTPRQIAYALRKHDIPIRKI
jgi:Nif-specific regulatory protein